MSILRGPKFGNSHQAYIPDLVPILDQLKDSDRVKKIILGQIFPCRPSIERLKLRGVMRSVLSFTFRGKTAIQELAVTCLDNESATQEWDNLCRVFPFPSKIIKRSRFKSPAKFDTETKGSTANTKRSADGNKSYQNLIDQLRAKKSVFRIVEGAKKTSRNKKREVMVVSDQQYNLSCRFNDYEWHKSFQIIVKDPVQKNLLKNYILSITNI